MSSRKTTNLKLHAWEGNDPIQREEFNENFTILDNEAKRVSNRAEEVLLQSINKSVQVEQDSINRDSAHANSTTAHKSENITYSGTVPLATNVKNAIETVNSRIENIVGQTGQSNTEIVDARLGVEGTAHATLKNRLDKMELQQVDTNRQTQILQHGISVINSTQSSSVDIEIYGRTLTSLSNTPLELGKYYVLADKRTWLKWADASITKGIAKFLGKAEKPIIIRIANYEGKVSGSTVENPHKEFGRSSATLDVPSAFTTEGSQGAYNNILKLDGALTTYATAVNSLMAQRLFSFDLIQEIERNIGRIPRSTVADKVQWLKDNVAKLTGNWHGFGSSVGGNKATLKLWKSDTNAWLYSALAEHTLGSVSKVTFSASTITDKVDSNGFVHFLAHAEPAGESSPGVVVPSTINTDYIELEIELKPTAILHDPLVPLYEVDATEYANILVSWDETAVLSRYPKVQSVKHLDGVAVIAEGENLADNFYGWTLASQATIKAPYELELNATAANQVSQSPNYKIAPLQNYTVKVDVNTAVGHQLYVREYDKNGVQIGATKSALSSGWTNLTISFVSSVNADYIDVRLLSNGSGKFTFTNLMVNLGSTPKPFASKNSSYLFAQVKLGQIGDKKDILFRNFSADGQWAKRKVIEDVILDGSLAWALQSDFTGFKRMRVVLFSSVPSDYKCIKFDGKQLANGTTDISSDRVGVTPTDLWLSVSDTDTGFGETYTPTSDEIKAYFWGWCAKSVDGNGKPTAWRSLGDNTDAPTQTITYVRDNKAPNFTPYKLSYVLANQQTINVNNLVEGDIVAGGQTQVEVTSAVVVREKVTPYNYTADNTYHINHSSMPASNLLKNKVEKILDIYKNGQSEMRKWSIATTTANGKQRLYISGKDYDPTATYEVTYLCLDRHLFTVNATEVRTSYAGNLKEVLDMQVEKLSDIATRLSVTDAFVYRLLLAAKVNNWVV